MSPQREGNQFLGEGGVQDIFYGVVRYHPLECTFKHQLKH